MEEAKEYLRLIGDNVIKQRNKKKISQQALADYSNIAKSTVQRIERGELNPTILMLKRIADSLGIEVQTLLR